MGSWFIEDLIVGKEVMESDDLILIGNGQCSQWMDIHLFWPQSNPIQL